MKHILLVEDDQDLGATLHENLSFEGYSVEWVSNGRAALEKAQNEIFDLLVLDIMLPEVSGLELLQVLRTKSQMPVLLISAKGSTQDRIRGLELEADDYLPKPFHLKEFLLRVHNLLKRQTPKVANQIQIGQAMVRLEAAELRTQAGESHRLTQKELGVLKLLVAASPRVVSRDEILNTVWGREEFPSTRTVDNIIVQLRKWIEPDPSQPHVIISHRGVGYCLKLQEEHK